MLLQKQKEVPYIHVFKLVSGEEVIAKVVEHTLSGVVLKTPLQVVVGQHGPQFAPFMVMADAKETLSLNKSAIVADASPVPELEGQYESITTGIALPQKSTIITK